MNQECRLRIDPNLVNKFLRLPGGINEVGVKIVRDLGLKFSYDKRTQSLDIIGDNPDILGIAIETLRFWVEDDDFPSTGITCQIGYPNKCMVIWRYHGDFAKKLDHLFAEEISLLKKIPTVVFKAVPTKRNPEYLEVYCHFTFYERVKADINNLSAEVSKICHDDFFVPYSDCMKAKRFVKSRVRDQTVLYALKENHELNRLRVWIFGRYQSDVIRAKKDWIQHVGDVTIDHDIQQTPRRDGSVKSARFYGHLSPNSTHRTLSPTATVEKHNPRTNRVTTNTQHQYFSKGNKNASNSDKNNNRYPIKIPKSDHSNYPRPSDFVYPVDRAQVDQNGPLTDDELQYLYNPFNQNELDALMENSKQVSHKDATISKSGWERASYGESKQRSKHAPPNRIYVHRQVNEHRNHNSSVEVVHPETNLMPSERYRKNKPDKLFSKSTTKRNTVKTGAGLKPAALLRQKPTSIRPQERASNVRFHININGLDIYMYKHAIVKLDDMDAIAIPVNENIDGGGNLAFSVFDMAGPQVTGEINIHRNIHGPLDVGESMVSSAGRLPFLGIIYVSGPVWENYTNVSEEDCARDLHRAIYSAMKTAEKHKYRKIGLSVVGSEPYFGVPKDLVAEVHVKALVDYSMGMGPLFPVLEVHLVDSDINMLTYIKNAYDKWSTDNSMVDMTQHLKAELPDQQELSERGESAVTLKAFPSHHSENMVTFAGQSYTAEGNQMWTFDVLKRLLVHVYTGSLVKIKDVEAIVCGVSQNFRGTLAKLILNVGGTQYEEALKRARRGRDLAEGNALVCEAGSLSVDVVLHAVVDRPILKITEKNLTRLDALYSRVLQAAHTLGIRSLALPLIATGRLREKFEVEQCGLQLIDCIIELCLSQGQSLKLRELHLVNLDPVITQSLTQALRTRAHTKLRVESDPHPPSRPEMLSFPDSPAVTNLESQRVPVSTRSATEGDIAEEFKQLVEIQRGGDHRNSKFSNIEDMNTLLNGPKNINKIKAKIDKENEEILNITNESLAKDKEPQKSQSKTELTKKAAADNEQRFNGNTQAPYLSKRTLQEHTRIISKQDKKVETNGETLKAPGKMKLRTPFQVQQNNQNNSQIYKDTNATQHMKVDEWIAKTKKNDVKKRKRLPAIRGYVKQKSRAESYRSIYIRRQRIAEQLVKEQHVQMRRAKSTSHLHRDDEKRKMPNPMTARETKYVPKPTMIDIKSKPPHATRLDDSDEKHKKSTARKPAVFRDKEREDRYMKEMEMFFHETNGPTGEPNSIEEPTNIQYRRDGSMNIIESDNFSATYRSIKSSHGRGDDIDLERELLSNEDFIKQNKDNQNVRSHSRVLNSQNEFNSPGLIGDSTSKMEKEQSYNNLTKKDQNTSEANRMNHGGAVTELSDSVDKSSKPIKLIISSEVLNEKNGITTEQNIDQTNGKEKTNKPQRKDGIEIINFKNDTKSISEETKTVTQNDVTIRDKLTLEIDVKDREPSNLTREKEKIKRFWEVVGGKDVNDDKDLYGNDNANGERVLMTRVKKERKMSAKSKSSKQSDATNVTAKKLGKYNVTVEVA